MIRSYGSDDRAAFVDAAEYPHRNSYVAVVVDHTQKPLTSVSVNTKHSETAEEVAIALALVSTNVQYIISDSQTAIRNYAKGRISPEAWHIIIVNKAKFSNAEKNGRQLLWFPAHTTPAIHAINPNEVAHREARGLTRRAEQGVTSIGQGNAEEEIWREKDRLTRFSDITKFYQNQRRILPPPHTKLNRTESVAWRRLQTETYVSPVQLKTFYPEIYASDICKLCKSARATLQHMLWGCKIYQEKMAVSPENLRARWSATLLSSELQDQLWAVQRAMDAVREQQLPVAI